MSSLEDRREDRRRAERRSWWRSFMPGWLSGAFWMLGIICLLRWVVDGQTGWFAIVFCSIGIGAFVYAERLVFRAKTGKTPKYGRL